MSMTTVNRKQYSREYYLKNKENHAKYYKKYYKLYREKILAKQKKYNRANKKRINEYMKEYYHKKKWCNVNSVEHHLVMKKTLENIGWTTIPGIRENP